MNKNSLILTRSTRYLSTMVPMVKGDHIFNSAGEQEWQIDNDVDVEFSVYG